MYVTRAGGYVVINTFGSTLALVGKGLDYVALIKIAGSALELSQTATAVFERAAERPILSEYYGL